MDAVEEFLERAEREIVREQSQPGSPADSRFGFRLGVDPRGTVQACTFCGAPGYWSHVGCQGSYVAPRGHTLRRDGTLDCPRSKGDRFEGAPYWEWKEGELTRFFTDSSRAEEWRPANETSE